MYSEATAEIVERLQRQLIKYPASKFPSIPIEGEPGPDTKAPSLAEQLLES